MRSQPSSWTTTLTKLGFRRCRANRGKSAAVKRSYWLEPLEARQMFDAD